MIRRPPRSTRTDTLFPYTTLLRSAIAGELVDQVEQFVRLGRRDVASRAPFDEAGALRVHLRLDLLAHGAPQKVGVAQRIARQYLGRLHHLFLIDEDAVG